MSKKKTKIPLTLEGLLQSFIKDLNDVEDTYNLRVSVDDVNPFSLVIRNKETNRIIAWLGKEEIEFSKEYCDISEEGYII